MRSRRRQSARSPISRVVTGAPAQPLKSREMRIIKNRKVGAFRAFIRE
jgi:hypothetical protein